MPVDEEPEAQTPFAQFSMFVGSGVRNPVVRNIEASGIDYTEEKTMLGSNLVIRANDASEVEKVLLFNYWAKTLED